MATDERAVDQDLLIVGRGPSFWAVAAQQPLSLAGFNLHRLSRTGNT